MARQADIAKFLAADDTRIARQAGASQYDTRVKPHLALIEGFRRHNDMAVEEIAKQLGISADLLHHYRHVYPELDAALMYGEEASTILLENALFKKAVGCKVAERHYKRVMVKTDEGAYDMIPEDGEDDDLVPEGEDGHQGVLPAVARPGVLIRTVVKELPPDPVALEKILKARKPEKYGREKPEQSSNMSIAGIIQLVQQSANHQIKASDADFEEIPDKAPDAATQ
jgi:hypothetical protein